MNAARYYALRAWKMSRDRVFCEICGHWFTQDTITDEVGPRSIVRGACDCTRSGRAALRDLETWPEPTPPA